MEVKSTLAKRIDTAGDMISYDEACKQVLANKVILAWILKTCIIDYKDIGIDDIAGKYIEGEPEVSHDAVHVDESAEFISGTNTENATIKEGTTTFDIKFRAVLPGGNETAEMIINVESQNDYYPGYPLVKRGIYYAGRMISEQYGTVFGKSEYQKIKKVASIWICTNPPDCRKNTITRYLIEEDNVVGNVKEPGDNYDLIKVVMVCLGGKGKDGYSGLLKMLDVLLSRDTESDEKKRVLNDEFGIPMTTTMEGGFRSMCNLSQGVVDDTSIDHIKSLMKKKGWDIEECMDILSIPEDRKEVYRRRIKEEFEDELVPV